jgi:formylglycine-generating enzyme required for sulfatase activity
LWSLLDEERDPGRRFHAACALAYYDPDNRRWEERLGDEMADRLLGEHLAFSRKWGFVLMAIRHHVRAPIEKSLRDTNKPEFERSQAADLLLYSAANDIKWGHLKELVLEADRGPYKILNPYFMSDEREAALLLEEELARRLPADASEKVKDTLARRQAHAAVVLLQLDQHYDHIFPLRRANCIWEMLHPDADPRVRSYLIHRLGRVRVDPETLLRQYKDDVEKGVATRRQALLLSLGEFDPIDLPLPKRKALLPLLVKDYHDADAGIHSAADWLLRRWAHKETWDLKETVQEIDQEPEVQQPGKRRWYVTKHQGHTMAIIPPPGEFRMGAPDEEQDRVDAEKLHRRSIPRSFAIATKEVTVRQFREFLEDNPEVASRWGQTLKKDEIQDEPITGVTWLEAAQYCRWLSWKEGLPDKEMCYPSVTDIEKRKDDKTPLQMDPDYLAQIGYRLPTEAEWEYACRAGTMTSRHFGSDDAMLGHYAWYVRNSDGRAHPVGTKKPNNYGLFDMYGNAAEWCQDALVPYPEATEDREDKDPINPSVSRVVRGGSFASGEAKVRSAHRSGCPPLLPNDFVGLRVARTVR